MIGVLLCNTVLIVVFGSMYFGHVEFVGTLKNAPVDQQFVVFSVRFVTVDRELKKGCVVLWEYFLFIRPQKDILVHIVGVLRRVLCSVLRKRWKDPIIKRIPSAFTLLYIFINSELIKSLFTDFTVKCNSFIRNSPFCVPLPLQ